MSSTFKKFGSVLLALGFLALGFGLLGRVDDLRRTYGLLQPRLPNEVRSEVFSTELFSVGRALAVDYLWIGLQKMQEDGRYFDANQRADWICQLQPHFPSVWIFQAWNMSYNISVAMNSGEDRWRWVRNGYELLRDRGIPLNPRAIGMYQNLAWIFHHKIGGLSDEQHWYYKIKLARAMEDVIGWPNPDYDAIVNAPETWEALIAEPKMAAFVKKFNEFKIDPREKFLYLILHTGEYGEKVLAHLNDPANAVQKRQFEGFCRAQRLIKEWKMEPKVIGELRDPVKYFGPIDFRTPEAHAIYWSFKGHKVAADNTSFEALNNDRVVYGSLQELFRRGKFFIISENEPALIAPDISIVPVLHRTWLAFGKKWAEIEKHPWDGTAGETFRDGHINFLRKAVAMCYQYGDEKMAKEYWDIMTRMYPNPEYNIGMEKYIYKYVIEDIKSMGMVDVYATVTGFLREAYVRYALGDDYSALGMERFARILHSAHMKDQKGKSVAGRMQMAEWDKIKEQVQGEVLNRIPPEYAKRLRARLNLPEPTPSPEEYTPIPLK